MADTDGNQTPKRRGWVKLLLFISLAINLLVVGVIAGAIYRGGPDGRHTPPPVARNDLGLGPYGKALSTADRRTLRRAIGQRTGTRTEHRPNIRVEMQAVLAALRQEPFDPDTLRQTMGRQQERLVDGQNIGKDVLLGHLSEMAVDQRQAYADRLENALGRLLK